MSIAIEPEVNWESKVAELEAKIKLTFKKEGKLELLKEENIRLKKELQEKEVELNTLQED
eukprot:CAMPEP_0114596090 /NCGR_PEP_ID=MMETSP0125-20121206/18040_1 /TAXON_ID=485358 ORGANISM="Aristerostoma sp., Strain ATCC 50986" /NCGR_SAMPLE_ID=MMETSP0125 /ASSEMBLY_ACC=CAM_ASM_000245 /LENGTH=59 /DNA_ID=CAMNT_0001798633 /DNA_START=166 /DNA_END=345 /DNA_ORIENTATION=-